MPRGCKTCKGCGVENGPRAFVCKGCGQAFTFKHMDEAEPASSGVTTTHKLTKISKLVDWRSLVRGDRIKVVAGSGPYWPSKEREGEKIPMGYHGKFTVAYLDANGIHAHGNKKEGSLAHCYIWMGPKVETPSGLVRKAHKVIKLKPPKERLETNVKVRSRRKKMAS